MKFTKEEGERLSKMTGAEGLLGKVILSPKWRSKHQLVEDLGISGSQLRRYLSELGERGLVETEWQYRHKVRVFRPDPVKGSSDITVWLNLIRDLRHVVWEARRRWRATCTRCGYNTRTLPRQVFVQFLRCPKCGSRTLSREYVPLFT